MSRVATDPTRALRETIAAACVELHPGVPQPALERPPRAELGDYSTNAAMLAAPLVGAPPREVAAKLAETVQAQLGDDLDRLEVAGPGFLNLHMADAWMRRAAGAVVAAGDSFGAGSPDDPLAILVEFVSANPTGPVTVASGRHAAYGDSLARLLELAGHRVTREYYVNDAGGQIELFGHSIAARMAGTEVPEGGYEGAYVSELAERLAAEGAEAGDAADLSARGVAAMLESIAASLADIRVEFDRWSSERELHDAGAVEAAIERLRERGLVYESEGAVWLRSSELGDDKDRVLVRTGGAPTYFAADIAYHADKLDRGAELMINVLGADHHGYLQRMRAAIVALGAPSEAFEVEVMQLVNLTEGGQRAQMSKRRGEFATLDELVADIGVDATRFFLVQRSHETPIDIDLEVARRQSADNPVYYVQYAHARICSLFRAVEQRDEAPAQAAVALEPAERALTARLLEFPDQVSRAAAKREPHGIGAYAREVAADFHAFYRDCRVVGADPPVEAARLELCGATRTVIATCLATLGIEAPEEM